MFYDEDGKKVFKCVIHHDQLALNVYMVKERETKHMMRYGLCIVCSQRLQSDKAGFAPVIDRALCEYLNKQRKKNVSNVTG